MRDDFVAFAFDQLEDGVVAGGVMIDFQTFASQFGNDLFDRSGFVQLNQSATSSAAISSHRRIQGKQFLTDLRIEQVQIEIFLMKFSDRFFVVKIMGGLLVSIAHLYQIVWELARFGIPVREISFKIATVTAHCFAKLGEFLE